MFWATYDHVKLDSIGIEITTFYLQYGPVLVAELVEQSLPFPEVRGSNPVIGKNLYGTFTVNCIWKNENKVKQAGNGPFKKTIFQYAIILTRLWRMKQFKSVLKWHKVDHSDIRWVKDGMQIALPTQEKTRSF